jgi:hypothetical protein
MADQPVAVVGIYSSIAEADRAVYELLKRASLIVEVSMLSAVGVDAMALHPWINVKVARGASRGAVTGALIGGGLGWAAGAGFVGIPWFKIFTVAGPVAAALAGVVIGAMVAGLFGAMAGAGRDGLRRVARTGDESPEGVMLAVHCGTHADVQRAMSVLHETGAERIAERPEASEVPVPMPRPQS